MWTAEHVSSHVCQWVPVSVACQLCLVTAPSLVSCVRRRQAPWPVWPQHWRGAVNYPHSHPFPRLPVSLNCLGLFSFSRRGRRRSLERSPPITNFLSSYIFGFALAPGSSGRIPGLGQLFSVCCFLPRGICFWFTVHPPWKDRDWHEQDSEFPLWIKPSHFTCCFLCFHYPMLVTLHT